MTYRTASTSMITTLALAIGWVVLFFLGFLLVTYNAFVLRTMWDWFIVPAGFTALTKPLSIGIILIGGFLTMRVSKPTNDKTDDTPAVVTGLTQMITAFFLTTLVWGSAAIWHFWLL